MDLRKRDLAWVILTYCFASAMLSASIERSVTLCHDWAELGWHEVFESVGLISVPAIGFLVVLAACGAKWLVAMDKLETALEKWWETMFPPSTKVIAQREAEAASLASYLSAASERLNENHRELGDIATELRDAERHSNARVRLDKVDIELEAELITRSIKQACDGIRKPHRS